MLCPTAALHGDSPAGRRHRHCRRRRRLPLVVIVSRAPPSTRPHAAGAGAGEHRRQGLRPRRQASAAPRRCPGRARADAVEALGTGIYAGWAQILDGEPAAAASGEGGGRRGWAAPQARPGRVFGRGLASMEPAFRQQGKDRGAAHHARVRRRFLRQRLKLLVCAYLRPEKNFDSMQSLTTRFRRISGTRTRSGEPCTRRWPSMSTSGHDA